MATVAEVYGDRPGIQITKDALEQFRTKLQPHKIWANYDAETDSLLVYGTGKPVRGILVSMDENCYVIVDPTTQAIVGMQVEQWESQFVPEHQELKESWPAVRRSMEPEAAWSQLLRVVTFYIIYMLTSSGNDYTPQPA